MTGLFRSRRRRRADHMANASPSSAADKALGTAPGAGGDDGVLTSEGSLQWVGSDRTGIGGEGLAEPPGPVDVNSDPARAATDGLWEVIRPAAIVPEEAARQVLVELARRDLSNGGEWQSEPQLWSLYDGPIDESGTRTPELMGTIHVTYGTPTKYEITVYRVTVTAAGVDEGWTVASLTDEALGFGGLTLAQCPRATVHTPPRPFTY